MYENHLYAIRKNQIVTGFDDWPKECVGVDSKRTLHIIGIDEPHQYFIDDKPVSEAEYKEEIRKAHARGNVKFDVEII